ncbi:RING/Ubox like zinc-binding domain family protein [Aspergillus tubingensis]|uniref:RING/Ubox like zinc-binding domain family protein n=1 Tax=Aspergillus tubingensis TaxID=5068 RepID=UPI0015798BBD|nr:RING/Ubox like zinc-binding domain family protein [Aspergillus tubingensis]GFN17071.1 RING/Ubox like zinc-binding domain family protein [Aspergillus tubingensis]
MPLYEIEHSIPLDKSQRDELAQAITHIHTRKFATPSLFVNIRFIDANSQHNYVAGKERAINRIMAYVRAGGTRTTADFDDLSQRVSDAWGKVVNKNGEDSKERQLNAVFVLGAITTGTENGFLLPRAGEDASWLKANAPKFEELAKQGDGDFSELVEDLRSRDDLAV